MNDIEKYGIEVGDVWMDYARNTTTIKEIDELVSPYIIQTSRGAFTEKGLYLEDETSTDDLVTFVSRSDASSVSNPDKYLNHELLDRIYCLQESFNNLVVDHPSSKLIEKQVQAVINALSDAYQASGSL